MDDSTLDNFPEEIRQKIIQSRKAYAISAEIKEVLNLNFAICDLTVAATFDKKITISGLIDNENTREDIGQYLAKAKKLNQVFNNLTIVETGIKRTIVINNEIYVVSSLNQIQNVFTKFKNIDRLAYCLDGNDQKRMVVLMNSTHAVGIFLWHEGDGGFTTYNSNGNENIMQVLKSSNGELNEYRENMLITRELGFELLKYFLLKSDMYPEVEWMEG